MSDGWKRREYDPAICAQINADIEANCRYNIGDRIEEAIAEGNEWRAQSLRNMAQQEFNKMVHSNGELSSVYADIRNAFSEFSSLPGYNHKEQKGQALEDLFDLTWNEDGTYNIHPKGMLGRSKGHNFS